MAPPRKASLVAAVAALLMASVAVGDALPLSSDTSVVRDHVAKHAADTFREPSGYMTFPYLVPGGPYNQSWDWDSMFMGVALRKYNSTPYFVGTFRMFLSAVNLTTGELPGCITPQGPTPTLYHAKPMVIQAAYLAGKQAGDLGLFREYGDAMRALLAYWNTTSRLDAETGLHRWHDQLETGADNLVLSECPSSYSPECWSDSIAYSLSSPDIMTWLAREYKAYAGFLAAWQGLGGAHEHRQSHGDRKQGLYAHEWSEERTHALLYSRRLADAIHDHFWIWEDAEQTRGYYGAYNVTTRKTITNRTYQAAWPLWAGLAANSSVAQAALASLQEDDLWSPFGLRSTSSSDPRFSNANIIKPYSNWRGPVWINVGAIMAHTLQANGLAKQAKTLADFLVHTLAQDLRATGTWHEAYDSTNGQGLAAPGFLSWDTLGADLQDDIAKGVDPFAI